MTVIPITSRESVRGRTRGRCFRCGGNGAQFHHRRSRRVVDEHRHCPCNGVWLCAMCHMWAHHRPLQAKTEGYIVLPQSLPFMIPVWAFSAWWMLDHEGSANAIPTDTVLVEDTPSLVLPAVAKPLQT